MPVICPKCQHVRAPDATAPEGECPACGVIYAKAREALGRSAAPVRGIAPAHLPARRGKAPWLLALALAGAYAVLGHRGGWHHRTPRADDGAVTAAAARGEIDPDSDAIPDAALRAFATRVKAGEVVMYSTSECVYCVQAKGWLHEYGFAFTECNMSVERRCQDEFMAAHAVGTPFLVVRGRQMREGFGSGEFLHLLKDTDGKA